MEQHIKTLLDEYAGHSKVCCYNYDCEIEANRAKERIEKELEAKIKQDSYYKGYEEGQNSKYSDLTFMMDEDTKNLVFSIRKEVVEEIQKGVDIYKVPKELVRVNKLKADYIYVYDLNTFILNKLTN